ncbi:hypothetical protein C345_01482 [Cryptococcus neoformans A2-102-5]|nr:hypothetical protein C359_01084 [Cryptococcus neoformans var. grubii Bt120]OXG91158.1 hypothetical protein C346_01525 [Cryptococcus neoformans var. grubii D17-1]OXG98890.1 hypothetical protein C345_01482 [Cryptococcus neoformans var. grubii A2-102-5]
MPAPPTRTNSPASSSTSKPIFPADQLRAWIRPLLATTLRDVVYDHADPGRMKELSRGLSEKIKSQMLALHPRGFKYIITSTLTENNNQAGRGDLVCHWEGTDVAVQEMFSNAIATLPLPLPLLPLPVDHFKPLYHYHCRYCRYPRHPASSCKPNDKNYQSATHYTRRERVSRFLHNTF